MAQMLETEGIVFRVTQGLRTWDQQQALWQKGRDTDDNIVAAAEIVTKAPPGYSWHNFGLAVDVVPDDVSLGGFQADWNIHHPVWNRLIETGESIGLVSGSEWRSFPDWPHFQFVGRFPASPTDEVRTIFKNLGIRGVWAEVAPPTTGGGSKIHSGNSGGVVGSGMEWATVTRILFENDNPADLIVFPVSKLIRTEAVSPDSVAADSGPDWKEVVSCLGLMS